MLCCSCGLLYPWSATSMCPSSCGSWSCKPSLSSGKRTVVPALHSISNHFAGVMFACTSILLQGNAWWLYHMACGLAYCYLPRAFVWWPGSTLWCCCFRQTFLILRAKSTVVQRVPLKTTWLAAPLTQTYWQRSFGCWKSMWWAAGWSCWCITCLSTKTVPLWTTATCSPWRPYHWAHTQAQHHSGMAYWCDCWHTTFAAMVQTCQCYIDHAVMFVLPGPACNIQTFDSAAIYAQWPCRPRPCAIEMRSKLALQSLSVTVSNTHAWCKVRLCVKKCTVWHCTSVWRHARLITHEEIQYTYFESTAHDLHTQLGTVVT